MAGSAGRNLVLKDGGTTTIAAIKTKSVTINNEIIDISTDDSAGWRELLAVPGQKSIDISFDGITTDDVLREKVMSTTDVSYSGMTIDYPDGSKLTGTFMLVNLEDSGTYNDAVTFSGSLQSSGEVTATWPV